MWPVRLSRQCMHLLRPACLGTVLFVISVIFVIFTKDFPRTKTKNNISSANVQKSRAFTIDFANDTFRMDGERFRFVSGSFHYFRAVRSKWRRTMRAMRAAGLNALSTYVEWQSHEGQPGKYNFDGWRDVEHFLRLAADEGLYVLLRPGPFICGERDFGGLPPWLLTLPDIELRRNSPVYQTLVKRWFKILFGKLEKFLYGNGGPIILVQVENEYGSDEECDPQHAIWLRDLLQSHVQDNAVLYATDGAFDYYLRCTVEGVYPTVDFTAFQETNVSFAAQRTKAPRGPLVNSEFYTGWLTHWGDPAIEVIPTSIVVKSLREMLELGANVNLYMFFGGTNFGFTSGANHMSGGGYFPALTSYDYDSPLDEAGDPTEKYFAIRNLIGNYLPLPNIQPPEVSLKGDYGDVHLQPKVSVFDLLSTMELISAENPLSFEQLSIQNGFVLYETVVTRNNCRPCVLKVSKLKDRANVFLDREFAGHLHRNNYPNVSLHFAGSRTLRLLVENMGRLNHGDLYDFKGILSDVSLAGQVLNDWVMYRFPLESVRSIESLNINSTKETPLFLTAAFEVRSTLLDTYLDMERWSKGVVFLNGRNLGRYWSQVGPQYSLFVPSDFLVLGSNRVTIFEIDNVPENKTVRFVTKPNMKYDETFL